MSEKEFLAQERHVRLLKTQAKLLEAMDEYGANTALSHQTLSFTSIYYACQLVSEELARCGYQIEGNPFYTGRNKYQCTIIK